MARKFPVEGRYDVRAGAAGYAPIVGAFGGLSVTAIVVVFTVPSTTSHPGTYLVLATGLLIIAMFGSLLGALGMAAIGAEQAPTANLGAAVMYIAVPVAISVASTLGAFEVLAALYQPSSAALFAIIVAAGGLFGVIFTAFALADSTSLGPTDPELHKEWIKTQWLKSSRQAYRYTVCIAVAGCAPVLLAVVLRLAGVGFNPTRATANWVIGVGIFLTLAGTLTSLARTAHSDDGNQRGIRPFEAAATTLAIGGYVLLMMLFLP
ncbi:hypothetical protein [Micromonospora sp. NPDC005305]|uniref:hypothetical protein n=1 Tax=Micromonospora sp. NPDC005305 TaxID=3156875 RepID=UPI0033AC3373